jgi:hypothetical protein
MDCQTCPALQGEIRLTEGPRIDLDQHWMVEHCHPVSTPGWFVLGVAVSNGVHLIR